MNITPTYNFV